MKTAQQWWKEQPSAEGTSGKVIYVEDIENIQQDALEEIKGILNRALVPTTRIEQNTEYPMTQAERLQWLVTKYRSLINNNNNNK